MFSRILPSITLIRCRSGFKCSSSGWTLIEIATVSAIVGILAGLAIPSLMGMRSRMDLKSKVFELKQTLQQAQRNAIKMGKECKVEMDATSNPPVIRVAAGVDYAGCLPFSELVLNDIKLYENFSGTNIRFSYKGNSNNLGTMVLASPNVNGTRYCLVMSNGIGMMRTGSYIEDPENVVNGDYCEAIL